MLLAVCEEKGLNHEYATRLTSGFGGGVASLGEVCGAFMGGVLATGLFFGPDRADETEKKETVYERVRQFADQFAATNGALRCTDLLGVDLRSDEGRQAYSSRNLSAQVCVPVVENAVRSFLGLVSEWEES